MRLGPRFTDPDSVGFDDLVMAAVTAMAVGTDEDPIAGEIRQRWQLLRQELGATWDPVNDPEPPERIEYPEELCEVSWVAATLELRRKYSRGPRAATVQEAIPAYLERDHVRMFHSHLRSAARFYLYRNDPYEGVLEGSAWRLAPYYENFEILAAHERARQELGLGLGRSALLRLLPECWGRSTTAERLYALGLPRIGHEPDDAWYPYF